MTGVRFGGGREMRSDGRQPEVVLGWLIEQERIDGYGKVG